MSLIWLMIAPIWAIASTAPLVSGTAKTGPLPAQPAPVEEPMSPIVKFAKDHGVKIAIENVGNDFIMTPEQAVEYLDAINSEWVGFHFDIGNVGRTGAAAERWIGVLGKRISRIHVKDYSAKPTAAEATGRTRPKLLDGDTNWPAVMKALDDAGYSGWAISEQPGNQAADVETARDLAQRMDRIFAL